MPISFEKVSLDPQEVVSEQLHILIVLIRDLLYSSESTRVVISHRFWEEEMAKPRNRDPRRILRHGYKVYSQNEEDGIVEEIFRRIGEGRKTFVEIGVEDGNENNTARLLVDGWSGTWIEASHDFVANIRKDIVPGYEGRLAVKHAKATPDNVNGLIGTGNIDLLSIDVDFNDYWIWKAIDARPRVVVVEYNATWHPPMSVTVPYDDRGCQIPGFINTNYFGASLEALVCLGREKGYRIVGCGFAGINAFFVREDLVGDKFLEPATAGEHYEPPRYRIPFLSGHAGALGALTRV